MGGPEATSCERQRGRWAGWTVGLVLAAGLLAACESTDSTQGGKRPQVTSGFVSLGLERDFPAGTVSLRYLQAYGIAVANDTGTVIALRPVCPHDHALVVWHEDQRQFVCPQDGSRFDLLGRPLNPPAKQPLPFVKPLRNPDGTLALDLDRLYGPPR